MTRPAVHTRTESFYARLPDVYREADAALDAGPADPNGYPLLRWLSLLVDQLGDVADLIDRIDYYTRDDRGPAGDTSDLVDPATADVAWLPWLAQLAGVRLAPNLGPADQRAAIAGAVTGYLKGTKQGIAAAAATALTGTQYVRVIPLYGGDQWRVEVRTRTTETSSSAAVIAAIIDKHAKPAGVEIVPTTYAATWDQIEALGSWDAVEGRGSWDNLEDTSAPPAPPSYGTDIRNYMRDPATTVDRPGDQLIVVPNGTYTAGQIATNRPNTTGSYKGWLVLVAQSPGGVIVDQSPPGTALAGGLTANGDLEFLNSAPRVLFVGFKFINGTIRTATFPTVAGDLSHVAFWYCEHTFPATAWAAEPGHPVHPGDPSTQYHDAPRTFDMRYGTNNVFLYGCNLHDTGTAVLPRAGCSFLTFVGCKVSNLDDGGSTLDPNDIVHCDALGFVGGNYHDVTVTDCDLNIGAGSGYNTGLLIQDNTGRAYNFTLARIWLRNGGSLGGGMNLVSVVSANGIFGTMNNVHTFNNGFFELAEQVDSTTNYSANWSPSRINFTGSGNTFGTVQSGTDPATAWQAVAGQQYADYLAYFAANGWPP